jgi:hypothetical protein
MIQFSLPIYCSHCELPYATHHWPLEVKAWALKKHKEVCYAYQQSQRRDAALPPAGG